MFSVCEWKSHKYGLRSVPLQHCCWVRCVVNVVPIIIILDAIIGVRAHVLRSHHVRLAYATCQLANFMPRVCVRTTFCFGLNYHIAWYARYSLDPSASFALISILSSRSLALCCWCRRRRRRRSAVSSSSLRRVVPPRCSFCNSRYCCVHWIYDYWHILMRQRLCR